MWAKGHFIPIRYQVVPPSLLEEIVFRLILVLSLQIFIKGKISRNGLNFSYTTFSVQ